MHKLDISMVTKYKQTYSNVFMHQLKKIIKQGKDITQLAIVITKLANGEKLEEKYKDHRLINDKKYKNCRECYIEPDWLLVYKYEEKELILVFIATGSRSEVLNK